MSLCEIRLERVVLRQNVADADSFGRILNSPEFVLCKRENGILTVRRGRSEKLGTELFRK